jgi:hypothetical protein
MSAADATPARGIGLDEARSLFREARARFRPAPGHLVPDIVLLGLVRDVEENVQAAELLASSTLPHRAFPNARTAYEASQRAVLLVTAPDYDLEGAKAWVYSLKHDRDYLRKPRMSLPRGGPVVDPDTWFEGSLDEMAAAWEALAPGKGELLRRALGELGAQKGRAENWTGAPIVPTLRDRQNALLMRRGRESRGDTATVYNAAYAALCRQTHPGVRLDLIRVERDPTGRIVLVERPRDPAADLRVIRTTVASSLAEAGMALTLRLDEISD